jgi:hypothetical protein
MSETVHIRDGVAVTRYWSNGDARAVMHVCFQIDAPGGQVFDLDLFDALRVSRALTSLVHDTLAERIPSRQHAGTDKSPT